MLIVLVLPLWVQGNTIVSSEGETIRPMNLSTSYPSYRTNVIQNGDFNRSDADGLPSDWNALSSGLVRNELTTEDVHGGLQSLKLSVQGNYAVETTYAYSSPSTTIYVEDNLVLDVWMKVAGTNATLGSVYFWLQVTDGVTYYNLYFYFVAQSIGSNSSTTFYFNSSIGLDAWQNVVLDLTQASSQTIGSLSGIYISQLRFYAESIPKASTPRITYLDDLSLSNATYEAFPTGDFETDTGGLNLVTDRDAGTVSTADGTVTLNAGSPIGGYSDVALAKNLYGSDSLTILPGMVLSLDYLYQGTNETSEYSRLYLRLYNGSFTLYTFIYLGNSSRYTYSFSNFTSSTYGYRYFFSSQPGGWTSFDFDFSILRDVFTTSFVLTYIELYVTSSFTTAPTNATLQVDEISIVDNPISDAGLEYAWPNGYSNSMLGWYGSPYPKLNRSEDAYEGNYSAYIASETSSVFLSRSMNIEFKGSSIFTDFQLKILDSTIETGSYAYVQLDFDVGAIYYVFSYNASTFPAANSSSSRYLLVEIPEGSWQTLTRNIGADLQSEFGTNEGVLQSVSISTYRLDSDRFEFLVDSLDFIVDTIGPELKTLHGSSKFNYYDVPQWTLEVADELTGVSKVWVNYKAGEGWMTVPASYNGSAYSVGIPQFPYGTEVVYYFQANDTFGNISTFNSSSYSYSVGDDIPPTVELQLANGSVVEGTIEIAIRASDEGSNISSVQLLIDGTEIGSLDTSPFTFSLDTRSLSNGLHLLQARAVDNAGQEGLTANFSLIVDNDIEGPAISVPLVLPAEPLAGTPASVVVSVTDRSNISSVILHYRVDDGAWQEQTMTGQAGLYNGTLPAISEGQSIAYYISASDEFNQTSYRGTESDPFVYSLGSPQDLGMLESYLATAKQYYDQYEFFAGGLATLLLLLVGRLTLARLFRKKK